MRKWAICIAVATVVVACGGLAVGYGLSPMFLSLNLASGDKVMRGSEGLVVLCDKHGRVLIPRDTSDWPNSETLESIAVHGDFVFGTLRPGTGSTQSGWFIFYSQRRGTEYFATELAYKARLQELRIPEAPLRDAARYVTYW